MKCLHRTRMETPCVSTSVRSHRSRCAIAGFYPHPSPLPATEREERESHPSPLPAREREERESHPDPLSAREREERESPGPLPAREREERESPGPLPARERERSMNRNSCGYALAVVGG